jgi:hypothetical protein
MADPLANLLAESGGLTFNQAFANARARGETTFRWRDPKTNRVQTYTTARADDRPARPSNNAMLEATRARREATDLIGLPMMPADLPAKDRELWQYYTPQAREGRMAESDAAADRRLIQRATAQTEADAAEQQALADSSDRAKILGLNRQAADEHLAAMRDFEMRNAIESQVNEAFEPRRLMMERLIQQTNERAAEVALNNLRAYEGREQAAEDAYRQQQYQNQLRAQALRPVYPEALLPFARGLNALRGLFVRPRAPAQPRIEPTL